MTYQESYNALMFLSGEVTHNMMRMILECEKEDKYAMKRVVCKNLNIKIALFDVESQQGTFKEFTAKEFTDICSDPVRSKQYFKKLCDDMKEAIKER